MCKNATTQVSNLMLAERSTLVGLMEVTNVPEDTQVNVLKAYDVADTALAAWKPGTTSATIDETLNAALAVVQSLNNIIPPDAEALLGIVIGGIEAVVGIVSANNKPQGQVSQENEEKTIEAKIQATVPEFKLSFVDKGKAFLGDTNVAANHYKHEWNKTVEKADAKYHSLKVA